MLNSVWNLCRACPMPTDEKLHTEYKQSFTWHQDFQPTSHEVVKKPPESDSTMEPAMPRRKKYPESIERNPSKTKTSSRSRSAEPTVGRSNPHSLMVQSYPPPSPRKNPVIKEEDKGDSTEYQSQFAWPHDQESLQVSVARRFVSTGLIPAQPIRKTTRDSSISRTSSKHSTLPEGATAITEDPVAVRRGPKKTEYKAKYRPFSAYQYVDGNWKKPPKQKEVSDQHRTDETAWYKEVAERLKKADEYRQRSSGTPLYGERMAAIISPSDGLWNQTKHEEITPVQRESQHEEKSMLRPATAPLVHRREKKHTRADTVQVRRPASADYGKIRTPGSSRERKKPVDSRHEAKPAVAAVLPSAGPSLGREKRSPSRTKPRKGMIIHFSFSPTRN
ncbi:nuclear protein MDM1-like isoform X2 [Limulus polyphemus]|uniref:Nuclear protein MDM1 n=1 Tax=Limulus polyphemus TaxID=6850 RepID=A0ABM1SSQ6_LIMPO|nr:nuclear protein MDM1-like isoform X2 [Limulus polyphemus]